MSSTANNKLDIKPNGHDFSAMHQRMQWFIDQDITSCCMSLVLNGLDIVDYKTFGYMDLESRTPLRDDAIYRMYSNTKIVTSVAAMMLLERGAYSLDDPLEKHLPEFANMQMLTADAKSLTDTVAATTSMTCLLYTSPSPRDATLSRMPSSA